MLSPVLALTVSSSALLSLMLLQLMASSTGATEDGAMVIDEVIFLKTFLVDCTVVERMLDGIIVVKTRGNTNINMGDTTDENVDMAVVAVTTDAVVNEDVDNGVIDKKQSAHIKDEKANLYHTVCSYPVTVSFFSTVTIISGNRMDLHSTEAQLLSITIRLKKARAEGRFTDLAMVRLKV
ncbi:hypothetical protein NDU88_000848 [Pleurodeles waltl]|uniref:Secreted protein n=1 Tax=Pleurodeles waltl TaxID=8319 RepID=A0AAV7U554_PLEWA|nr:hypothetical protein NDU88_000848 [Pleurodeles waltl]